MSKRLLIFDGYNVFLRHFCVSPALNENGDNVGGVYGFLRDMRFLTEEFKAHQVFVCWEGFNSVKRRRNLFGKYKGNRKTPRLNRAYEHVNEEENEEDLLEQLKRIHKYLQCLPICTLYQDFYEADDMISFLCHEFEGDYKIIVSSDKDLWQLVGPKTVVYRPATKSVVNERVMLKEIEIPPINWGVVKTIIGDKSDELPGIKGIGDKTVKKLFPFLMERKESFLSDVIDYAEERQDQGKQYVKFVSPETQKLLKRNWKIIQLYHPTIDDRSAAQIRVRIEDDDEYGFDPLMLRIMFREDRFNDNLRYMDNWIKTFIKLKR